MFEHTGIFVPHQNLSDQINGNIIRSEIEGGVYLRDLPDQSTLEVATQNRRYTLVVCDDGHALISGHPEVEFDLYFPPYSILQWVAMRDASPATLKIVYDLTAHISERLTRFPNARLHDFRALQHVTHNLDNYGDVIHHSPAIDLEVLSWLADRSHVVDPSSPTASLDRLKAQVEAYKVER